MPAFVSRRNVPWLVVGAMLVCAYWPLLSGQIPAFRDSFHFYYPLLVWLDQQAAQGVYFPQYDPLDGTGTNVVGEATSALFYPGRVVLLLPGIDLPRRFGLYLLIHTLIAAAGAAYAAKRMQLFAPSQLLAAIAYSLSCPVFFQHTNPVYLVGAAWLPWALAECWILAWTYDMRSSEPRIVRWWLWIMACSLMLLGGDAQSTVNTGLITCLAWVYTAFRSDRSDALLAHARRLAFSVLLVVGLTAIQWLPTWYWLQHSTHTPPSIAQALTTNAIDRDQVPALLRAGLTANDSGAMELAAPQRPRYQYSVAPWHLITLVWGQSGGHLLPENGRIFSLLSAEPRMWLPSLSVGLPTALLAVIGFTLPRLRDTTRFWFLVAILAGGAMLGNYAPMWLVRCMLTSVGGGNWSTTLPGDETLGIYWLLTEVVPTYGAFRYPAKWSVPLALALCMCAAQSLQAFPLTLERLRRYSLVICGLSLMLLSILILWSWSSGMHEVHITALPVDAWLGKLDLGAALRHVGWSLAVASVIGGVIYATRWMPDAVVIFVIVYLTAAELLLASHGWLVTIDPWVTGTHSSASSTPPRRLWIPIGQANIERDMSRSEAGTYSVPTLCLYQLMFNLGKQHLLWPGETAQLSALTSLPPRSLASVRQTLAVHDPMHPHNPQLDEALTWLGIHERLARWGSNPPNLMMKVVDSKAQLVTDSGNFPNTLHVKHLPAGRLVIDTHNATASRILVRLYQDGGWQATLTSAGLAPRELSPYPSHLGLFQTIEAPAGSWRIELQYWTPGLTIGIAISVMTTVFLLLWRFTKFGGS